MIIKKESRGKLLGFLLGQLTGWVQFTMMKIIWLGIHFGWWDGGNQVLSIRNGHVGKVITFQIEMSITRWINEPEFRGV